MSASFEIVVDRSAMVVRIRASGFFTPEDVVRFAEERDKACACFRAMGGRHVALVDIRGMDIQSQDAVNLFRGVATRYRSMSCRLAVIVDRSLSRMQMKRVVEGRDCAFFMKVEDAEAWLAADAAKAAA